MKGRTQIIQNTQLYCVEHKKGEGFFFTDKIIVFRAQKSRRVGKSAQPQGQEERGGLGEERPARPPTSWVFVHLPGQRATSTSAATR